MRGHHQKQIEEWLKASGGIMTAADCRKLGIPTVYLSRMVQQGTLRRISQGLYLARDGDYDAFYFFQYRYKKAVFSHETALYLLGATDSIVQTMEVTVGANYKFNQPEPNVRVHYVRDAWLPLGVVETQTMHGNPVRVTCYERVICDLILGKDEVDAEVYVRTMQGYAVYPGRNPQALYSIAAQMGIAEAVRQVMELVL